MSSPGTGGTDLPVLVVGAGPVGVTAAAMLAARGVETLVVDRHPDVYTLPRAAHLDDETMRILQGVVGADAVGALTVPGLGLRLLDARHRVMAEFRRDAATGPHGYPQANMFDQPPLERLLRDRAARLPLLTLAGGLELAGLEQRDGEPVRATLRQLDGGTGGPQELQVRARFVLGCDGANSTARDLIGARMRDLRSQDRWLVVDVRTDQVLDAWDGVHQVCDPRRAATYMRMGPGRYRWEFRLGDGEDAADLLEPGRFAALLRPWTKDVPVADLEVLRSAAYTFRARVADRWRDRDVFLLGDAAHLTPPFIGQGLCAGLRDAANLTWKLAGVVDGSLDPAVLDTYEPERAPHARAVVAKAVLLGRVMTGGQDVAAFVRRVALAGLCRVPGFTTRVLDAELPRLEPGPLVTGGGLTGRLLPQPWVRVDGARARLDDVLGPGIAVVTLDPPGPSLQAAADRLGARLVRVVPGDAPVVTPAGVAVAADDAGVLASWLRTARARTVVVRPDRVVLAEARERDGGAGLAARIGTFGWLGTPGSRDRHHALSS